MLGHVAVGTWSGGRFMRFGEPISDERLEALLRPDAAIRTVMTADAYGAGEADELLGRALAGVPRADYSLVGAIGHDFYEGERDGAKGFPRFTDPRLRGPADYAGYLRMATERSLERIGADAFDLLLLHNPDRRGFESAEVWEGLRELRDEGLARELGVAPGPANGFTLDVIWCFERYGELIDWAMLILGPLEPWPGELPLAAAQRNGVRVVTRVVDYGGLFHDDVLPGHEFARGDHRGFRPDGWVEAGREKLDRLRPIGERHSLTPLQLACAWNLAHSAVECVAPTLIEEPGSPKPIERKREELARVPATSPLSTEEIDAIRAIGDNTGSMLLKGAAPDHDGPALPDRWPLDERLAELAARWEIDPARDLVKLGV
jgi:aryl-alcohol dehydrogenase-like predicted oxidoreductase